MCIGSTVAQSVTAKLWISHGIADVDIGGVATNSHQGRLYTSCASDGMSSSSRSPNLPWCHFFHSNLMNCVTC
jgi:hypothetical protein